MATVIRRSVRSVAIAAGLLALLPACGILVSDWEQPRPSGAIALVVGGRANMPAPQLTPTARDWLKEAFLSRDELVIADVSGDPRIALSEQLSHDCSNDPTCDGAVADFFGWLDGVLPRVEADAPEADTLGAILLAARQLKAADDDGPWHLIVIDSGLQTTGALPLTAPGAVTVDPATVVAPWLDDDPDLLADLAEVIVLWTGLGATYTPQPEIPQGYDERLEQLWTGIIEAGDAEVRFDLIDIEDIAPKDGLPAVTPVSFEDGDPDREGEGCFRIRDDQVGFLGNEATFRDQELAKEVLAPIADELTGKQLSVTVVGTTALPEDPPYPLSHARAEAVADMLAKLDVPRSTMVIGGVGTNFAGYEPPYDDQGNFVETLAIQYRLVLIEPVGRQCPS